MTSMHTTSRRDFLRASTLATAAFGTGRILRAEDAPKAAENRGSAKNVIFMVSDGMNHGALSLAQQYRMKIEQKNAQWLQLYRDRPVVRSLVETFSANSCVTDSAAASGVLLFLLFGILSLPWLWLRSKGTRVFDKEYYLPLHLCQACRPRVRGERAVRDCFRTVEVYDRLLEKHPDAVLSLQ